MERLMLQDLDFRGGGTAIELIVELFERIEPFGWLKVETTPAGPKYSAVREATGGRLHVSGGWASMQLIEALDRGVRTFMVTELTGRFARTLAQYAAGDRAAARATFEQMLPVLAFTRQHLDVSIHFHKQLMYRRGIFATPRVRKRTLPWDAAWQRCADELIERVLAEEKASAEGR
jgi:4-hydroxy-tetrahydrodipicolinate synthase